MFSKLFKPRWQQRDARSRLAAVKELDNKNAEALAVLMQLALNDDDEGVRKAALHRLTLQQALELNLNHSQVDVQTSVQQFINQQIEQGHLPTEQLSTLLQRFPQHQLEQRYIEHHPQQNDVSHYIGSAINAQKMTLEQALKCLRKSRHQHIALQLIESIQDANLLQSLLKNAEQFDKRSNQLMRDRLRLMREQQKIDETAQLQLDKTLQRIEQLAKASFHPLYEAEVQHLDSQWAAFKQTDENGAKRFAAALELCREKIAQQKVTATEVEAVVVPVPVVLEPVVETQIVQQESAEADAIKQQQEQLHRQIDTYIQQLEKAVEARDRKSSLTTMQALRQLVREQKVKLHSRQQNKMQHLQAQLDELEQWQQFAVLPKLEQLCAAMQTLSTADIAPKEKAEQIRLLQDEWKQLKLPHSEQAQQLWTQFKAAAEIAYAPCAAYFAAEKTARATNLQQRLTICESLEQYVAQQDWAHADWRAVEKLIDTAIKEYARFHPVERGEERTIKTRFDSVLKTIKDKLYQEYRRVEQEKKDVLAKASVLLQQDNAIDAAKQMQQLQQQWKIIGNGKHHSDQSLWRQFQDIGNQIFAKRRDYFEQKHQADDEVVKSANSIIEQMSALTQRDDKQINQTKTELVALKQHFNALTLPEKHRQPLQRQFRDALHTVTKHIDDYPRREKQRRWQELSELADICQQLEYGPAAELIPELQQRWQSQPDTPNKKLLTKRFEFAVSVAEGKNTIDFEAVYQQRRELCVHCELRAGTSSPSKDLELRRSIQLTSLAAKFTPTEVNPNAQYELLDRWWTLPSASAEMQIELNTRVHKFMNFI